MPSLKELRNRIASVKSTQKITKAMQMVAVSKLRRAQGAVESARPYAEQVETVLTNLAGAATDGQGPRLLVGSGSDQTHLLLVCTGERGLCGAFNTAIVRLAREKANSLAGQGKTVKILCVGKKGYDQLRRTHERQILELIDLRAVRTITYETAKPIAEKVIALFDKASSTSARCSSRAEVGIAQIPRSSLSPGAWRKTRPRRFTTMSLTRRNPPTLAARRDAGLPRTVKIRPVLRRADSAMNNTTPTPAKWCEIPSLQPHPRAMITRELIESSRRRAI
jgi:F-type H+-transporting ATPase subunit gamma